MENKIEYRVDYFEDKYLCQEYFDTKADADEFIKHQKISYYKIVLEQVLENKSYLVPSKANPA